MASELLSMNSHELRRHVVDLQTRIGTARHVCPDDAVADVAVDAIACALTH